MIEHADELLELGTATLGECGAGRMDGRLRAVWPGARISAEAYTVACSPGDNLGIHVAVAEAPAGAVLVADMGGTREFGYWGEVLTTGAEAQGLVGLVIDGCVRDVDALEGHGFAVFSTGIALGGASKNQPASIGGSATVGDVEVSTGDWVVADRDGVVVISRDDVAEVLAAGQARQQKEALMFVELQGGATTIELLGLDPSPVTRG